jgi:hypothetical protein
MHAISHPTNYFKNVSIIKFIDSQNLYLGAASTKGDVYFFSRPGPANLFRKASKGTVSELFVCETFVKRGAHCGEVFAIGIGQEFIATGGIDGRVLIWAAATGVLKNTIVVLAPD